VLKRIVVGIDGTTSSFDALRWADGLARLTGASLVMAHVFEPRRSAEAPSDEENQQDLEAAAERHVRAWIEDVGVDGAGRDVSYAVRPGDAHHELATIALDEHADLLVVGARGESGVTRLGFGSVARDASHEYTGPVAAVPPHCRIGTGGRIVVAFDGSEQSEQALVWAVELAEPIEAGIVAVEAHDPLEESYPRPDAIEERELPIAGTTVALDRRITTGDPVEALSRIAAEEDISVVVIGSRGGHPDPASFFERVPMQLLHECERPVILVPVDLDTGAGGSSPTTPSAARDDAVSTVRQAELSGVDGSRLHIAGTADPVAPEEVRRNDRETERMVTRPAVTYGAIGAIVLAAALLVVALVAGWEGDTTLISVLGGAIVGGTLGALFGLYSHLTVNRDVWDAAGAPVADPDRVRVSEDPDEGGPRR
jgi:nucleotide-binding universal stress UspA family protein